MADTSADYEVEKIVAKRVKGVEVEYKLKWKNFPSSQNSWVNINQMSCPQLIEEFELEQMANIVGVKRTPDGQLQYACEYKSNKIPEYVDSNIVKAKWLAKLATFLETIITFVTIRRISFFPDIIERPNVLGLPLRIISCSDVAEELMYLCEYANGDMKFVTSNEAKTSFPNLVVQYLEPKIVQLGSLSTNLE